MPAKVTRVVTTTETAAAIDAEPEPFYKRDFWEIINTLGAEEWNDHMVRVYRADEKWENDSAPKDNKLTSRFDEDYIRTKFGGGRYNLWMYGPPSGTKVVRRPFRLSIEGPAKASENGHAAGDDGTLAMVLRELLTEIRMSRGGNVGQEALKGALDLQAAALKSGVETVRSLNPGTPSATLEKSALERAMEAMLTAMIGRMMNPTPDPFQAKLQEAMLAKLLDPADPIEKFRAIATAMKDFTGGSAKTDFTGVISSFVGTLPSIVGKAVEGVREFRLANESAERTFILQKDHNLNAPGVIDVPATPPATPAVAPPAPKPLAPETGVVEVQGPTLEWIQLTMVDRIQKNPEIDGADLYDFLEAVAQELNEQLSIQTPETMMGIFKTQPILSRVADNPRLPKIIETYLSYAKECAKAKPV